MRSGAELLTGSSAAKCFSVTDYFSVHHTLSVEIGQPLLYTEQVRAGLINTFLYGCVMGKESYHRELSPNSAVSLSSIYSLLVHFVSLFWFSGSHLFSDQPHFGLIYQLFSRMITWFYKKSEMVENVHHIFPES